MTDDLDLDHGATRELPRMAPWTAVSLPRSDETTEPARLSRIFLLVGCGALALLVLVGVVGVAAARQLAERQSVNDAANTADLLAEAVVQPALLDNITTGSNAAVQRVAAAVTPYLRSSSLVRVKLWAEDGTIVWSDEPRIVGQRFPLDDEELGVLADPRTVAEVSDADKPENRYERGRGKLLEAYRPVWTPDGTPLLFETYTPYDEVDTRTGQLWRGFAGVTVSSLLVFTALLLPLLWQLVSRVRAAQRQREALLQRAVDASADERRRIAGTLHDGVVQDLAGVAFAVSGAAVRAADSSEDQVAADLHDAAATLRTSIGGLRTLLVDIYPETLESAGLLDVLGDLASTLRSRGIDVHLDLPDQDPGLGPEQDRLVFRIVHECLQNVRKHAAAANVWVSVRAEAGTTVVEIADDGVGFDPAAVIARPEQGHFGLRVLADLAGESEARLWVSAAPGAGCTWRLALP